MDSLPQQPLHDGRISGLDGLRAYSVITVVVLHLHIFISWYEQSSPLYSLIWHGVEIFFVISGFLITHLLMREHKKYGEIHLRKFLARRALRIFPLFYLFITAIVVASIPFNTNSTVSQLFFSAIYAFNFIPRKMNNTALSHTWSLAVEEHFYLIWPPIFMLMLKRGITPRRMLLILAGFFVILECFNHYIIVASGLGSVFFVERWTSSAATYLLAGCMGGILINTDSWNRIAGSTLTSFFLVLIFGIGFLVDFWYIGPLIITRDLRIAGILAAILWVVSNQNSALVKILEFHPIRYVGQVSYGIYIWQGFYLGSGPSRAVSQDWPPSDPWIGVLLLCITVPLSYHFFEMRFLNMKNRFRCSNNEEA